MAALRKKRDAEIRAHSMNWNVFLKPPLDSTDKLTAYSWLEEISYFIETALKAYLVNQYGLNFPKEIIRIKNNEASGGTHNINELLCYLDKKDDCLVKDMYLATDLETNGEIRLDIEKCGPKLKNMVQYGNSGFPKDYKYGSCKFISMMHSLRVFSLHIGNILYRKLESRPEWKNSKEIRHLYWDVYAPRADKPIGCAFIQIDPCDQSDRGVIISVPWDTINNNGYMKFCDGKVKYRFPMDWVFGDLSHKLFITVITTENVQQERYDALIDRWENSPPEKLIFSQCKLIERNETGDAFVLSCERAGYAAKNPDWPPRTINEDQSSNNDLFDCDTTTPEGQLFMMTKIKEKHSDFYREQYRKGMTDLHLAANRNFDHVIKYLAKAGFDINSLYGEYTPLQYVVTSRDSYVAVLTLLDEGAEIETKDRDGSTPLLNSLHFSENARVPSLLIDRGANILTNDRYNLTALHYASFNHSPEISSLVLSKLEELKKSIPDAVNSQDKFGRTPLHIACAQNNKEIIILLLDSGASKKIMNNEGQLPIDIIPRPVDPDLWKTMTL